MKMTKFADQLFEDLMHEHGRALEGVRPAALRGRRIATRPVVLAGAGTFAVGAAVAGVLVAGSGTPAAPAAGSHLAPLVRHGTQPYAVRKNPGGTITLAVYQRSGIAAANARLQQMGEDQVVVVPVEPGCPSLAPPAVSGVGMTISSGSSDSGGTLTVNAQGIPAGDILVVGVQTSGATTTTIGALTSPPAPACISLGSSAH
jgi:hypothetical protein